MKNLFLRFARRKSGARLIEYGLIAAGVGVAIMTIADQAGSDLNTLFISAGMGLR